MLERGLGSVAKVPPTSIAKRSTGDPRASVEIELSRPTIGEEEIASVASTLRSGWLIEGPRVAELERALEERLAPAHVRCLNSATAALTLALRLVGVERGSEVVLPSLTFAACANVVEHLGATPVLVDSEPATGLIDLDAAERAIGPRTKAIMPVHLGGRPVDLGRVAEIRDRHGIAVVEDAAHAIGAEWGDVLSARMGTQWPFLSMQART